MLGTVASLLVCALLGGVASEAAELRQLEHEGAPYWVCVAQPGADDLRLFWRSPAGAPYDTIPALRDSLARRGLRVVFATNSGIYDRVGSETVPLGLHVEDGRELVSLNSADGEGNFYWKPNGVFAVAADRAAVVETGQWPPREFGGGYPLRLPVGSPPGVRGRNPPGLGAFDVRLHAQRSGRAIQR